MGFLPGIFGKPAAPQQQPNSQQAPTVPQQNATTQGGGSGSAMQQQTPANPGANPAAMLGAPSQAPAGGPQNPLDSFTDYFKPKAVDPNAVKAPTLADPILGPLDPTTFRQQVSTANFAASIPQETIQKAMGGDAQAFADAINVAAREAFAAAAQLSHGLVEQGSRTAAERVNGSLDSRIRNFQVRTQNTSNEALTHPAVAPMLNAVKMQIAQSNPQLSPDQVQQQAETYFTQMADVLVAPKQEAARAAAKPSEPDFSYLLQS